MASGVRQTHQAVWSISSFHSALSWELIESMQVQGLITLMSSPLSLCFKRMSNISTKRHHNSNRPHQISTLQNNIGKRENLVQRQVCMKCHFPKYCSNMKKKKKTLPNSLRFPTNICEHRLLPLPRRSWLSFHVFHFSSSAEPCACLFLLHFYDVSAIAIRLHY